MVTNKLIYRIILIFVFVSVSCLNISQAELKDEINEEQKEENLNILLTPILSAYAVTEKWNCTSGYEVLSVAVSADGNYIAVGTERPATKNVNLNHYLLFFNTSDHDGLPIWSFNTYNRINSIAISADGKYIAAGSTSGMGYLLNNTIPESGEDKQFIWSIEWDYINSVDISADGKYIAVGGQNAGTSAISVYNNSYASIGSDKSAEYLWTYNPSYTVLSVAISSNGMYVAAGTDNTTVTKGVDQDENIFFLNNTDYNLGGIQSPMWSYNASCPIDSITISADGSYVAAATSSDLGKSFLLNSTPPESGMDKEEIWYIDYGSGSIYAVDITADGKYIVMGWDVGDDGLVVVYDNLYPLTGHNKTNEYLWYSLTEESVKSVSISADGQYIAAGTEVGITKDISLSDTVFLYNNTDYILGVEHLPTWTFNTEYNVNSVSMSAWGNYIVTGGPYSISDGKTFLFYHDRPIPIGGGGDGGDDDDNKEEAIPFGNYYLLFAAIALLSSIIIMKRKTIFYNK